MKCESCKYYIHDFCEELDLHPIHPEDGCAFWSRRSKKPHADVVEVVRCMNCKHWRLNYHEDVETCSEHRNVDGTEQATGPNDYCSWAERREDE